VHGGPGSLVELDVRFARSRRKAERRRERLRRPRLRRRLRRRALAVLLVAAAALGAVGGPRGLAEAQRLVAHATPASTRPVCGIPATFVPAFRVAARETGLPLALLASVGSVESRMDQAARSDAGAVGIMQVMPPTAAELRLDPSHTESNVLAGASYLKHMLDRYESTDLALAAYNAGPTAVDEAGGIAPTAVTATYVANVQAKWRTLAGCR
jgi:soluble lytic murein transglycosylase-like protein